MRVKLIISYDGSSFLGSQKQKYTEETVETKIAKALLSLGVKSKILFSGRTDRGVHALNQVISIVLESYINDLKKVKKILNKNLKPNILIKDIKYVTKDFHPRFDAKKRTYRYIISQEKFNPFLSNYVNFINFKINIKKLKEDIKLFEGKFNFKYFKKSKSANKSDIRIIYKTLAYEYKGYIILNFEANSFLRSQVRILVAFLLLLNQKKIKREDIKLSLLGEKRLAIKIAPACGLYLNRVKY